MKLKRKTSKLSTIKKYFINQYKNILKKRNLIKLSLILVVVFIILNRDEILKLLLNFGINEYSLIRQYIETILSWPTVVLVISIYVINKFSDSIKIFLENIVAFKAGPVEMSRQSKLPKQEVTSVDVQEELKGKGITLSNDQIKIIENEFDKITKEKQNFEQEIGSQKEIINYLAARSELYEFAYLNLYLVPNTKSALLWFNSQTSCTHEYFIHNYQLPPILLNPIAEKEAIVNALLTNQLLEQESLLLKINEKGKRFLKSIGYIN